jgi:transposase InsO family protein
MSRKNRKYTVEFKLEATQRQARTTIFEYIEGWYNRHRLHSALGYLKFELNHLET